MGLTTFIKLIFWFQMNPLYFFNSLKILLFILLENLNMIKVNNYENNSLEYEFKMILLHFQIGV